MSNEAENWGIATTAQDYFAQQKKRQAVNDRRPVIRKASDLVGPGIGAQATRITDFNDPLATYNGFFSAAPGAANAPNSTDAFVGLIVSDAGLGGVQRFTDLSTGTNWRRVFNRNPLDANTIYWGDWISGS